MTNVETTNVTSMASIFVGDLGPEVNDNTLYSIFSNHGQVLSVKICRDAYTSVSLGYAYVNYRTKQEAEKAIKMTNYTSIDGRPCRVMWSVRDPNKRKLGIGNLFVKNIHPDLDSKALYEAFSAFGPVMSCKIAQDEYSCSKGFGFVQFYNEPDSEEAIKKVDGVEFRGKKLYVTKFLSKHARVNAVKVDPKKFTNVFVKNFGQEWCIDEFKTNFTVFGDITSCVIQCDEEKKPLGYGFVNFSDSDSALKSIEKMNGLKLKNGNELYVAKAMKKAERIGFLKMMKELRKKEMHQQYREQNLYVKNFDESYTDEKFNEDFSKFGKIRSAKVMRDESNRSKCFGFVCFNTADEANAAIEAMHAKVIDGKPLYVAIAQNKDERRKILEQQKVYSNPYRGPAMGFPPGFPYMYPQPQLMPFPNHFHQYRNSHAGARSGGRGMVPHPQMNPNIPPSTRYPYNYQANGSLPQHFRPRNPQMNQSGYRNERYIQPSVHRHPYNSNYPQRTPPPHVSVNNVIPDSQSKSKREEKQPHKIGDDITREDYGDHVYMTIQQTLASHNLNTGDVQKVCGAVLDFIKTEKKAAPSKEELGKLIISCYKEMQASA